MEKIKGKWTKVTLKDVLKVKNPKLSKVLIVHGTIGEDRLQKTCGSLLGNHHIVILTSNKWKKTLANVIKREEKYTKTLQTTFRLV